LFNIGYRSRWPLNAAEFLKNAKNAGMRLSEATLDYLSPDLRMGREELAQT
jgi:hypothetical protein